MKKKLTTFWDFIDNRAVIRRVALFVMIWISWKEFCWAAHFVESAYQTGKPSYDVAATIAAVTAPLTLLSGYLYKIYNGVREKTTP